MNVIVTNTAYFRSECLNSLKVLRWNLFHHIHIYYSVYATTFVTDSVKTYAGEPVVARLGPSG